MHTDPITDFHHVQTRMGEARQVRRSSRRRLQLPRFRRRAPFPVTPHVVALTE
jgi:hypothetical protein